ncbi:hypothetical protein LCM10_11515 [Rossellomorea aquimaris]|uniref:hypothetical protein n=1 Tax=Rossellomorea aquimaris TaxID=189382 RepID=UPI001CD4DC6E|nr:hypothetical protein [Rossellomorea aquimaris]MCA1055613.1 hypothetical protein [Rossellomorea aquimaris]
MKNSLQIYLEYEIKQSLQHQYRQIMNSIIQSMPLYDAVNIRWEKSEADENRYIETFVVPTESHYHAIKRLRTSRGHLLFGRLDDCICGGLKEMKCIGLKKSS